MTQNDLHAPSPTDLSRYAAVVTSAARPTPVGRLSEVRGLVLKLRGLACGIGDVCEIERDQGGPLAVEVMGLRASGAMALPLGPTDGLEVGARVRKVGTSRQVAVGSVLLGRVLDGLGNTLDGRELPRLSHRFPLSGTLESPLHRRPIVEPLSVGVRSIDAFLTLGRGQRIGIFAGGGVGKSTLLGMMVRRTAADVAVVALVGERAREVEHFSHQILGEEGLKRSVVIAETGAAAPMRRVRAALYACTVAEYFRSLGKHVLLVMDSVTRFAMALREVGLALGEPPATKGYPPSVFAAMPRLLERAGTREGSGSITGIYTVLVEGDELTDPVADATRAILDGHIVLARELAERGHFPAIAIEKSVSRVMTEVVSPEHAALSQKGRALLADYREVEDLVSIGAYQEGSVPRFDAALRAMPDLETFLRQAVGERDDAAAVLPKLERVLSGNA